jgi:ATP-dependent Clp protease protease subunit
MNQGKEQEKEHSSIESKIEEMLIAERKIFLSSQVDDKSAKEIIRKVWYLEHINPGKPILFIINSPGGSVDSGFAIWDQMQMISSPINTLVTGLAASMGSILSLVAGKGKRFATKNSRFMIHQPLIGGVIHGQATDLEIQAKEIIKTRNALIDIYVKETGKTRVQIEKALDRDTWMSAKEAKEFGLIDEIVQSYKSINMN